MTIVFEIKIINNKDKRVRKFLPMKHKGLSELSPKHRFSVKLSLNFKNCNLLVNYNLLVSGD